MASSLSVKQRGIAAILGAVVADAAVQPLHWIYSAANLASIVGDNPTPEFWKESHCPYYTLETGHISNYADQALVLLKTLINNNGFSLNSYIEETIKAFGPGTDYDKPRPSYPIKGPWRQMSITQFLENVKKGKQPTGAIQYAEIDGPAKIVPLVAFYAGKPELEELVEAAVRTTQDNDLSVHCTYAAAKILEAYILHGANDNTVKNVMNSLPGKYGEVKARMQVALGVQKYPHRDACRMLGCACELPGSFMACTHGAITQSDYATGVRSTLLGGGSNCGRACFIGACLAAQGGIDCIPSAWIERTFVAKETKALAEKLMDMREKGC